MYIKKKSQRRGSNRLLFICNSNKIFNYNNKNNSLLNIKDKKNIEKNDKYTKTIEMNKTNNNIDIYYPYNKYKKMIVNLKYLKCKRNASIISYNKCGNSTNRISIDSRINSIHKLMVDHGLKLTSKHNFIFDCNPNETDELKKNKNYLLKKIIENRIYKSKDLDEFFDNSFKDYTGIGKEKYIQIKLGILNFLNKK